MPSAGRLPHTTSPGTAQHLVILADHMRLGALHDSQSMSLDTRLVDAFFFTTVHATLTKIYTCASSDNIFSSVSIITTPIILHRIL